MSSTHKLQNLLCGSCQKRAVAKCPRSGKTGLGLGIPSPGRAKRQAALSPPAPWPAPSPPFPLPLASRGSPVFGPRLSAHCPAGSGVPGHPAPGGPPHSLARPLHWRSPRAQKLARRDRSSSCPSGPHHRPPPAGGPRAVPRDSEPPLSPPSGARAATPLVGTSQTPGGLWGRCAARGRNGAGLQGAGFPQARPVEGAGSGCSEWPRRWAVPGEKKITFVTCLGWTR